MAQGTKVTEAQVIRAGVRYFREYIVQVAKGELTFEEVGGDVYAVESTSQPGHLHAVAVVQDNGRTRVACDCRGFQGHGCCKHAYGVALVRNLLPQRIHNAVHEELFPGLKEEKVS